MRAMLATVAPPQDRPVHRRGFLCGRWLRPGDKDREIASRGNAPSILVQARPDRVAEIALRLGELGIGAITGGDTPSRFAILLAGGVTVTDALASVCGIPGVLAATLASPSLREGGA